MVRVCGPNFLVIENIDPFIYLIDQNIDPLYFTRELFFLATLTCLTLTKWIVNATIAILQIAITEPLIFRWFDTLDT